ncbi:MAG: hypothetical protein QG657_4520, partial [Acidobacteriota bacterium]|nr:hypothetical protein [Acidobacteriota bacterium]
MSGGKLSISYGKDSKPIYNKSESGSAEAQKKQKPIEYPGILGYI